MRTSRGPWGKGATLECTLPRRVPLGEGHASTRSATPRLQRESDWLAASHDRENQDTRAQEQGDRRQEYQRREATARGKRLLHRPLHRLGLSSARGAHGGQVCAGDHVRYPSPFTLLGVKGYVALLLARVAEFIYADAFEGRGGRARPIFFGRDRV